MTFLRATKTILKKAMAVALVVLSLAPADLLAQSASAQAWNLDLYDLTLYPTQATPIRLFNTQSQYLGQLGPESRITIRVSGDLVRASMVNGHPDIRQILRSAAYQDVNANFSLQLTTNKSLVTVEGRQIPAGTQFLVLVNDFLALTQSQTQEAAEVAQTTYDPATGQSIDDLIDEEEEEEESFHETEVQQFDIDMAKIRGRPFPQGFLSSPVCDCGSSCVITSQYGPRASRRTTNGRRSSRFHKGMDVAGPEGTPIVAAADGCVSRLADNNDRGNSGYGNSVYLAHGNGYETQYSHLKRFAPGIRAGACFKRGDTIGFMGHTGNVVSRRGGRGTHLHFSLLQDGNRVDPWARYVTSAKSNSALRQKCSAQVSYPTTDEAMRNALSGGRTGGASSTVRSSSASR